MSTSGKLTLAALTEITTSPGPARGEGRSSTTQRIGRAELLAEQPLSSHSTYACIMPTLTTDDGVKLYYEEAGSGTPIVFVHEFARRPPQLGAAGAPLLAPLPLHRLQRARLSALRRAGGLRALFAGARARRHPLRARRARHPARARRRPVDGRLRHAAFRHGLRPPRAVDHRRRRRLRLAPGAVPPVPGGLAAATPSSSSSKGMAHFVDTYGHGPHARAVPEQGSARLRRVHAPARRSIRRSARRTRCSAYQAAGRRSTT